MLLRVFRRAIVVGAILAWPITAYAQEAVSGTVRVLSGDVGLTTLSLSRAEAQDAAAQERSGPGNARPGLEVIASFGLGHVFRFEDRGYGTEANFGVGVDVPVWRRLRAGAEVSYTFGLSPRPAPCPSISLGPGLPTLPCIGSARSGVSSVTAASFHASYHIGSGRVQPYVLGGVSLLWTTVFSSVSAVRPDHIEVQELTSSDTGAGLTLGFGVRTSVTQHLSIRPEFRFSDGTALSRANLSLVRLSVGVGYGW
jgi:opacity protein-like surface antigen